MSDNPRKRLPDERKSRTRAFTLWSGDGPPLRGYVTVGEYDDGRPGEVFVRLGKPGEQAAVYDQWAIASSLALQCGLPIDVLCGKFINARFEPSGVTDVPGIRTCTSILDLVCRWLLATYGPREAAVPEPPIEAASASVGDPDALPQAESVALGAAAPTAEPAEPVEPAEDLVSSEPADPPAPALLACPSCAKMHLDIDEWAVKPHTTHRCVDDAYGPGCGKEWMLNSTSPVFGVIGVALRFSPIDQATLEARETCHNCGKHVRDHYGGRQYRCAPMRPGMDSAQSLIQAAAQLCATDGHMGYGAAEGVCVRCGGPFAPHAIASETP